VVVWGNQANIKGSSDLWSRIPNTHEISRIPRYHLLVDKGEKQVSSTVGHDLMHPMLKTICASAWKPGQTIAILKVGI
jgi:hypothetical protein